MTYKIISKENIDDVLKTTIQFEYDLNEIVFEVSHFRPSTLEDVELGIQNRITSEVSKIEAVKLINQIVIPINEEKTI